MNQETIDNINKECEKWIDGHRLSDNLINRENINGTYLRAVSLGIYGLTSMLLHNGANVDAEDEFGHTAIDLAILSNDAEMIKELVSDGIKIDMRDVSSNATLLLLNRTSSITGEQREKIRTILQDELNRRCLVSRDLEEFKKYFELGADVNAPSKLGRTMLHWHVSEGNLDIVKFLIENGADVNAKDNYGNGIMTERQRKDNPRMEEIIFNNK